MPQDIIYEFLNENQGRSYPLESQVDLASETPEEHFPKNVLLDLRGFVRGEPIEGKRPRFVGAVGPDVAELVTVDGTFPHPLYQQGYFMFVFGSGGHRPDSDQELFFTFFQDLPSHNLLGDPLGPRQQSLVVSPFGNSQNEQFWGSMEVTFCPEAVAMLNPALNITPEAAYIEASLFLNLWESEISRFAIEDAAGRVLNLTGSIEFRAGHNMNISSSRDGLTLSPERGAGMGVQPFAEAVANGGESWYGSDGILGSSGAEDPLDLLVECKKAIYLINGVGPRTSGEFSIIGENGVVVKPDPIRHRIVLDVTVLQPNKVCP